ncbi:ABC transporter ATP-binding protein [Helicobacter pylori]|uniref:ABC transporter ATP-binding protein n=1 Tax=Helicobacter pylori TaxID=210 RepID=UPI0001F4607F|nr:ABC transporter ATP-binding protein [Helicobacter pylori]EJB13434.1 iron(III) dicitrate ABC transporter, ATP-binding protein [Helicobacter pylori CPY1962]PUD78458.1 ABC transporter ATP-binding protein [Helicobacter pylori]WJJ00298.1 ABC transporter ATP-binding protein [Helicobacter pylori]WJJ05042.1 ABC transporter ATP-binding protein [Helicobacter pylori]WJX97111.1 ABC transporter ATP-binding protein [Helicobacter pylori]
MVLEVKNLSFKYSQKLILDKLSFSVPKNSITSILAPNGSGKTTLLKCLLGLLKPLEETEIKACNKDILPLKPYEKAKLIAYIPQVEYYAFNFSVLDFVLMGKATHLNLFAMPKAKHIKEATSVLERLDLESLKDQGINDLSGGQRQMVLLARSLLQRTPLLLLDEPTSALDLKNQALFFDAIKDEMKKRELSVLVNIHDPNLVARHSTHVVMLKDKKLFLQASTQIAMTSHNLSTLYDTPLEAIWHDNKLVVYAL